MHDVNILVKSIIIFIYLLSIPMGYNTLIICNPFANSVYIIVIKHFCLMLVFMYVCMYRVGVVTFKK